MNKLHHPVQHVSENAVALTSTAMGSAGLWLQSYTEVANSLLVFVNLLLATGGLILLTFKLIEKVTAWLEKRRGGKDV